MNSELNYGQNIKKHQWKNRVLLVFTEDVNNDAYKKQLIILKEHQKGLLERKLIFYSFTKKEFAFNFEDSWQKSTKFRNEKDSFKVILIGLDGGTKLEQTKILSSEKLLVFIGKRAVSYISHFLIFFQFCGSSSCSLFALCSGILLSTSQSHLYGFISFALQVAKKV